MYQTVREELIVEVYGSRLGTGYAIAPDLILTARHVVIGDTNDKPVSIRPLGLPDWTSASVVWAGTPSLDAALLKVEEPLFQESLALQPIDWGRLSPSQSVLCRATGFPASQAKINGTRDTDTIAGSTLPLASQKSNRIVVASPYGGPTKTPTEGSPDAWGGMSGAALFSSPDAYLIGIVTHSPKNFGSNRLEATPITQVISSPDFSSLVGNISLKTVGEDGVLLRPIAKRLPQRYPDSWLLDPQYAVVDFVGRSTELEQLKGWAAENTNLSVAIVIGSGGSGKTRLAIELAQHFAMKGWDAGLLSSEDSERWSFNSLPYPTLLIVDYASRHQSSLSKLLIHLNSMALHQPVKILLLDRRMGFWWENLNRATKRVAEEICDLKLSLTSADISDSERNSHAQHALTAYSRIFGIDLPKIDEAGYSRLDTPLLIHMNALLLCRTGEATVSSRSPKDVILTRLLDRERERWEEARYIHELTELSSIQSQRAVALVALTRPALSQIETMIEAISDFGAPSLRSRIANWLEDLFDDNAGSLGALGPDLLIGKLLADTADLRSLLMGLLDWGGLTTDQRVRALHILTISAEDSVRIKEIFADFLIANLEGLIEAAVSDQQDDVIDSLHTALSSAESSHRLSKATDLVWAKLPRRNDRLAFLTSEIAVLRAQWHRKRTPGLVSDVANLGSDDLLSERFRNLGGALMDSAEARSNVGSWGEAVNDIAESASIYRALYIANDDIDDADQLAICLSRAGLYQRNMESNEIAVDAGERAVRLWREVVQRKPHRRTELAIALTNLAGSYCSAGRPSAGFRHCTEAITILSNEIRAHESEQVRDALETVYVEFAHHCMEAGYLKTAKTNLQKSLRFSNASDPDNGYYNKLMAEISLREEEFDAAIAYAETAAMAYLAKAKQNISRIFWFRGAMRLLLETFEKAGRTAEALQMREEFPELLRESTSQEYESERSKIGDRALILLFGGN
ncbi:trypsin-like peptidase domain-containing protein [Actinoplanes hulinensis]|uniref:Trypsin-like peptidase domain-containing protein n=1 Tax=Actinoplanes hulinensis TaxID=1144547 RepID=A0ABS7AW44_9ACTN|nr:serine protease [Actinoplanes hulinensis]MBW6432399.1 trypsin-like peptidase domain-containing protein [Actinoplanes hulinensis]